MHGNYTNGKNAGLKYVLVGRVGIFLATHAYNNENMSKANYRLEYYCKANLVVF